MSDIRVQVPELRYVIFDKRELKAAIKKGGGIVRSEARRLISRRAVSAAGEIPGYDSGAMSRSIKVKVGSAGGYARIMPTKTAEMGDYFYPAFLAVGTRRGLRPRKDFMQVALDNKQFQIRAAIVLSMQNALRVMG